MQENLFVLNSDSLNKDGFRFTAGALLDSLEQKALEGVSTCLGHDIHKCIGWTIPFALYFEPGMCRLVGNMKIAETDSEQKQINIAHKYSLQKSYNKQCNPHEGEFKKLIGNHLTEKGKILYSGTVCFQDTAILNKTFPHLFENLDKDGLVYLSDLLKNFSYMGQGIFKDNNSELAIFAHPYFRKSLSRHNNLNYYFLDELISSYNDVKITLRIKLDNDLIGYAKTYKENIELEYWRGPLFNNDISNIKSGVTIYKSTEYQKLFNGISQTEFWWKDELHMQSLEVEELKEDPSPGVIRDSYGCRYVHSIFDKQANSFDHFDGAIRMYDTEKMLERIETDIKGAGKNSVYTKLFRIDGQLSIASWKSLVCHYFQSNHLIHEYFGIVDEVEPYIIQKRQVDIIERLIPYSLDKNEGIRLCISYHSTGKREIVANSERYISSCDVITQAETTIKIIESDVIELKKALNRCGSDLSLPEDVSLIASEDFYWNVPTISHLYNQKLEENLSTTLEAFKMLLDSFVENGNEKIVSFTIALERQDEKEITISILGHSLNLLKWLAENKTIPIDDISFRKWIDRQSAYINQSSTIHDKPSLSEMIHEDGVLYMKRRALDPSIDFKLNLDEHGNLSIKFNFTKDQIETAVAYNNGKIDIAPGYLLKKTICSKCGSLYQICNHSKYLDSDVYEIIEDASLISLFWTNPKS